MAKISVIIPSFNCAPFLQRSIDSVLGQTFDDLDVLIVDDGSTDESVSIIENVSDSRVRTILLPKNTGGASALNVGIKNTSAPLIAICNADDEWWADKLDRQMTYASDSIGAVFSDSEWIDEKNRFLSKQEVPQFDVFSVRNRSRHQWIRDLYENNCLCHPSVLIQRKVYEACGLYDNRFRQLPDFDMWLRVIQKFNIFVAPDKLVRFRLRGDQSNTSAVSPANSTRDANETALILEKFFRSLSEEDFVGAFGTLQQPGSEEFCLELEKIFLLASKPFKFANMLRSIATRMIHDFLEEEKNIDKLNAYGESFDVIHRMQGMSSPFHNVRSVGQLTTAEKSNLASWSGNSETFSEPVLPEKNTPNLPLSNYFVSRHAADELIKQRESRIAALKGHIFELESLISDTGAQRDAFKFDLGASAELVMSLKQEIAELQMMLTLIGNSRSWKYTAAVRRFRSKRKKWPVE